MRTSPLQGIAKLFAEVCEVFGSGGSGAHFCSVVVPQAECIVASVAIRNSGKLVTARAKNQVDLLMRL